jgi:hypothetical protein
MTIRYVGREGKWLYVKKELGKGLEEVFKVGLINGMIWCNKVFKKQPINIINVGPANYRRSDGKYS